MRHPSLTILDYYLKAVNPRNFVLLLGCTASYSFFVTIPQFWLQRWTEAPASQTRFFIGGYLIFSLLAWAATNGSMWQVILRHAVFKSFSLLTTFDRSTHMRIAPESGLELHRRLLSTIFRFATPSKGFEALN